MKKKAIKTPRDFSKLEESTPVQKNWTNLEEHNGFKIDDSVFYNSSLVNEKYVQGLIREIIVNASGSVAYVVWDLDRQMWRTLSCEKFFHTKPVKSRKKLN